MPELYDIKKINEFVRESNAIEGVYSDEAFEDAMAAWAHLDSCEQLNLRNILDAHRVLLSRIEPLIAGNMRTVNVRVGSRVCPPWHELGKLLTSWFMNHAGAKTEEAIKRAHIAFEKIHPFQDGNGRIGRIILNWQRQRAGLPVLVIKESERSDYYKWFH